MSAGRPSRGAACPSSCMRCSCAALWHLPSTEMLRAWLPAPCLPPLLCAVSRVWRERCAWGSRCKDDALWMHSGCSEQSQASKELHRASWGADRLSRCLGSDRERCLFRRSPLLAALASCQIWRLGGRRCGEHAASRPWAPTAAAPAHTPVGEEMSFPLPSAAPPGRSVLPTGWAALAGMRAPGHRPSGGRTGQLSPPVLLVLPGTARGTACSLSAVRLLRAEPGSRCALPASWGSLRAPAKPGLGLSCCSVLPSAWALHWRTLAALAAAAPACWEGADARRSCMLPPRGLRDGVVKALLQGSASAPLAAGPAALPAPSGAASSTRLTGWKKSRASATCSQDQRRA